MKNEQTTARKTGEAFHIRHRNFFVGLFLLVPFVVLPTVFLYTVGKSDWLQKWNVVYVKFNTSAGVKSGNDVTIRGIRVGYVTDVNLDESGSIVVKFRLRHEYAGLVKRDSRAKLQQTSLVMGDWQIELVGGTPGSPQVENGDVLEAELPLNMGEIVNQALVMFRQIQDILKTVQEGKGTLGRILMNDTLAFMVEGTVRDVRRMIAGANGTLRNVNVTLSTLDTTLRSYTDLSSNGMNLVDTLSSAVAVVNEAMRKITPILDGFQGLPGDLTKTLNGLQRDLRETETVLKAVQRHPLIRKEVKQVKSEEKGAGQTE